LSTGTGVAPFMSIVKGTDVYERFERIILVHGVRWLRESKVVAHFIDELMRHEILGADARAKLVYYPTITGEPHTNRGRVTTLIADGKLSRNLFLPALGPDDDRVMICGSRSMLADMGVLPDSRGFKIFRVDRRAR
jgi:ferredoxin/flavodoxin---NADP+ reductase